MLPIGGIAKSRHVERREGERAFAKARGHLSQEVPLFRAVSALCSLTIVRERKRERRWPRAEWEGADESRLYET